MTLVLTGKGLLLEGSNPEESKGHFEEARGKDESMVLLIWADPPQIVQHVVEASWNTNWDDPPSKCDAIRLFLKISTRKVECCDVSHVEL